MPSALLLLLGLLAGLGGAPGSALLWRSPSDGAAGAGAGAGASGAQHSLPPPLLQQGLAGRQPPGAYPNAVYVNYAKEVDMSSGARAARANDGVQHGFYGQDAVAATDVQDSPWLRVDLGQLREARAPPNLPPTIPSAVQPQAPRRTHLRTAGAPGDPTPRPVAVLMGSGRPPWHHRPSRCRHTLDASEQLWRPAGLASSGCNIYCRLSAELNFAVHMGNARVCRWVVGHMVAVMGRGIRGRACESVEGWNPESSHAAAAAWAAARLGLAVHMLPLSLG